MKSKFWLPNPEVHDFPAASDYLDLHFPDKITKALVNQLKVTNTIKNKAKDILRASDLPLLPKDNLYVRQDLLKIKKGKKLSPVLLVRCK